MKFVYIILLIFGFTIVKIDGLKVLTIAPLAYKSHFTITHAISKSLLDAGHEITMLSPFPLKNPVKNYTDLSIAETMDKYGEKYNLFDLRNFPMAILLPARYYMLVNLTETVLMDDEVIKLMKSKEKYDVCLFEALNFLALLGIVDHFDCVAITYTTSDNTLWIDSMTSNQSPNSYITHSFLRYTDKLTFSERFVNTLANVFESVIFELYYKPIQRKLYIKHFPNAKRTFDEVFQNSAIHFINYHVSSAWARPYLPNIIEIGGIHVESVKKLPSAIQEFVDSADEGVIVFSMGSLLKATDWPLDKTEIFVNVFGKLKQKVLWKYENDTLPGKSDNVMISKWLPQRDLFAHPNVKLFITHGGLLGTTEAVVEGVPLLGIPVFGETKKIMANAVAHGYALQILFDDIDEDSLYAAIIDLLSNQKYRDNAQLTSKRFSDRRMTPQETVVYWVEYAVRHKGAPHFRAAGKDLNFIEFHSIDTYSFFLLVTIFYLYIVYLALKFLLQKCCGKYLNKNKKFKQN